MTRSHPDRIDPVRSERLAIARVLCILCMVWVHVPGVAPDGAGRGLVPADGPVVLQALLVEGPGRAGAALLSVVSGWLCAHLLLGGRTARALIAGRARTILVPMLFWGGATVALYALVSLARPTFLSPTGPVDAAQVLRWIDAVAFLSAAPSGPTLHLSFLRDLFVCTCLAPLLLAGLARAPSTLLVALGLVYLVDLDSVLVLRPLVLFGFALGLWLARTRVRLEAVDPYLWPWIALTLGAATAVVLADAGALDALDAPLAAAGLDLRESVLYPLSRLFGALAVWALTARLAGRRAGRLLAAQMPWLFTTYCTHFVVLTLVWDGALAPLGASADSPGFVVWFLAAPLLALLVGRATVRLTLARWPAGAVLLGLRDPSAERPGGRAARRAPPVPRRASDAAYRVRRLGSGRRVTQL